MSSLGKSDNLLQNRDRGGLKDVHGWHVSGLLHSPALSRRRNSRATYVSRYLSRGFASSSLNRDLELRLSPCAVHDLLFWLCRGCYRQVLPVLSAGVAAGSAFLMLLSQNSLSWVHTRTLAFCSSKFGCQFRERVLSALDGRHNVPEWLRSCDVPCLLDSCQ